MSGNRGFDDYKTSWRQKCQFLNDHPSRRLHQQKIGGHRFFLEHGRIEVDDSSVKWIGADRTVLRIPVATVSVILLGPGTTITHAAIKAMSDVNTPICWVGNDSMRFYAFGVSPTHDNARARHQAKAHASITLREKIAKKMFEMRFAGTDIKGKSINALMGMEGKRVKALYAEKGMKYGVSWKGRNYNPNNWELSDSINRAVSAANASLYALCTSMVCSMGYLPQLGFIHSSGTLPFVFDIADIYKPETTLEAAFQTIATDPKAVEKTVITRLKFIMEDVKLIKRIPRDIEQLLEYKKK